jgi:hypothetical protein
MSKFRLDLRFVVYREDDVWLAHCLELDIVAEGASANEALRDALRLCAVQFEFAVEQGDISSAFRAAPPEFWAMYAKSATMSTPQEKMLEGWPPAFVIGSVEAREPELCGG